MNNQPDHAAILDAVAKLDTKLDEHIEAVRPLVDITPELKDWVAVIQAATVGRKVLLGLASLGAAIGVIIGCVVAVKFALREWLLGV